MKLFFSRWNIKIGSYLPWPLTYHLTDSEFELLSTPELESIVRVRKAYDRVLRPAFGLVSFTIGFIIGFVRTVFRGHR